MSASRDSWQPEWLQKLIQSGRINLATRLAPDEGIPPKPPKQASPKASTTSSDVTRLRSLSPKFDENEHEGYVQILVSELKKTGDEAPLNIALTGHYGSGKSSVLIETTKRLRTDDYAVTNLSLPSLGIGNGRLPKDGEQIFNTTNLIQKEIVKQLLYRRAPSEMPASRYNRLDTFDEDRARTNSRRVGIAAIVAGLLLSFPSRVEAVLPDTAWNWLDKYSFDHLSTLIQWASFVPLYFAIAWVSTAAQRVLQQRLRITELGAGAGPAKLKLSETTSSYFDEYLDEIVYFFQTSGTTIVVFEDLDRFKNPQIFETLRELNLLLNNAAQIGGGPIRFVYAIRDSIFEQLDDELSDPESSEDVSNGESLTTDASLKAVGHNPGELSNEEKRRLITTNRTKFFDLVVPMVPFISHRTSRNLMRDELQVIPAKQRPSQEVVDLVGSYITDMRLIKNICNEYDMFRTRILRSKGLQGLTPDKLFASIVYKNLYLSDYERLRTGDSLLDDVYRAYRAWVAQRAAAARNTERAKRIELRKLDSVAQRSERLGKRLQEVLVARRTPEPVPGRMQFSSSSGTFGWDDLVGVDFWRSFLKDEGDLTINYDVHSYQQSVALPFSQVETLVGEPLNAADWTDRDRSTLLEEIAGASARQLTFAHASLTYAIDSTGEFTYKGESRTLEAYAADVFRDADVVTGLLQAGFIDENFTLYVTQFPGDSSASAINFVLKAVQPNVMDIDYHFGLEDAVNGDDIKAVLDSEGARLLKGKSVYNKEIFDYLFVKDSKLLAEPIRRLADGGEDAVRFIDAYLASGAHKQAFLTELSGTWTGVLDHLIGDDPESVDLDLLDAALRGANAELNYDVSDEQREIVDSLIGRLNLAKARVAPRKAASIAAALSNLGILVSALDEISAPLRSELISRSALKLNRNNLQAIVGEGKPVSLDVLKAQKRGRVYDLVLGRLPDYIDILDEEPIAASIAEPTNFVAVLEDVGKADDSLVEDIAERASESCIVTNLEELSTSYWPMVASAERLTLSASNVAAYLNEHGLDGSMKALLATRQRIEADGDQAERLRLALELLNANELASDVRVALVQTLDIEDGSIAASSLSEAGQKLIPELLVVGLIPDDMAAYEAIQQSKDYELRQRVMSSSKNFGSYMLEMSVVSQDLHIISWDESPEALKVVVAENFDTFGPSFGTLGSNRFAQWAAKVGRVLPLDAVELLASKAESPDAAAFLKLLEAHADDGDIEAIRRTLTSLGGSYEQIAVHGRDRPTVPIIAGVKPVLERLKREGIVSKYDKEFLRNDYRVSKHHS